MPDPKTEAAAPAEKPVLTKTDPYTGIASPIYLGGDPLPEIPVGGDRGDDLVPGSQAPASLPSGSAAGALAAAAAKAAEDEAAAAAAAEAEIAAAAAKVLSDAEKAALPKRGEDGKFLKAEDEGAKDEGAKGEEPRIPKSRLDKEIERRKAAEARLAEKTAAEEAAAKGETQTFDFDAAETEYMDLLLDGKLKEAAAKRKEIRAAERAENEAIMERQAEKTTSRATAKTVTQDIGDRYAADYAERNPESETFDELAMAQVKAIYGGYLEQGLFASPDTAFAAALETVVKANGFAKVEAEPAPKPLPAARTAADRVAAIGAQPPSIAQAGQSSAARGAHEVDVTTLTEDQLAKLPQATLRRLRGDDL